MTQTTPNTALQMQVEPVDQIDPGLQIEAFTFGDDVSVLDGRETWGYFEGVYQNGDWYEPPVPMRGLAKAYRMAAAHQSAIAFKVQQLGLYFEPTRWMSAQTHEVLALDLLQMGNCYAEELPNLNGRLLALKRSPALHTRVGVEPGTFYFVKPGLGGLGSSSHGAHKFATRVHHLFEPDVEQEVYGLPQWLAALQSGLLNENATLFRRRYFKNGAHAGFVFYLSEPTIGDEAAKAIRDQLTKAKGVGNFKNLFIHAPAGKKDGVQIMPIAEVAAKDEFIGIKDMTTADILTVHRVPPQLLGIIPKNTGGFGDFRTTGDVFFRNEIVPIQNKLLQLNQVLGVEAVRYRPYVPLAPAAAQPGASGR